jgi:hypothetical protein
MYRDGWSSQWNFTEKIDFTVPGRSYRFTIHSLKPKTLYGFRIKSWYRGDPATAYMWPLEGQFDFETLADKPGKPSQPIARGIGKTKYEVSWDKADENGASIEMYSLEYRMESVSQEADHAALAGNNSSVAVNSSRIATRQKRGLNGESKAEEFAEKLIATEKNVARRILQPIWVLAYNGTGKKRYNKLEIISIQLA